MSLKTADRDSFLSINNRYLSLKNLSSININFKNNNIKYLIHLPTVEQEYFLKDIPYKNAIVFEKSNPNIRCNIIIDGNAVEAILAEVQYDHSKHMYLCSVICSMKNEAVDAKSIIVDDTDFDIHIAKNNNLDI